MAIPRWFHAPRPWRNAILTLFLLTVTCCILLPLLSEQLHIYMEGHKDAAVAICELIEEERWSELLPLVTPAPRSVEEIASQEKLAAYFGSHAQLDPGRLTACRGRNGMTCYLDLRFHWFLGYRLHFFTVIKP